ncbi:MAG: NAD-dependent epimerase/dehydratase family protein [Elusimicrobiota bacterium]
MKKVLVTGGCGFVGSTIIRQLLEQGIEAVGVDLPQLENRFAFKGKARFIGADLTDKASLSAKINGGGFDAVLHTAALFKYGAKVEDLHHVNVEGTRNLCDVMLEKGIKRLVNWSSSTVLGFWDDPKLVKNETTPINEADIDENYAYSKYKQEKLGQSYIAKGLEVTTIRPGDIYGPGTPMGLALPMYFFKIGLMRSVPGMREVFISHVHVDDVAGAAIYLAGQPKAANEIFLLADSRPLSTIETMDVIAKRFNTWSLPARNKTFGIPIFHTHPAILKLSGLVEEIRAKIKGVYPRFTRQSATYSIKNHILSNNKLLGSGYKLKWPDAALAIPRVIDWYEENKWAIVKG